jgi:hypothetical protein
MLSVKGTKGDATIHFLNSSIDMVFHSLFGVSSAYFIAAIAGLEQASHLKIVASPLARHRGSRKAWYSGARSFMILWME